MVKLLKQSKFVSVTKYFVVYKKENMFSVIFTGIFCLTCIEPDDGAVFISRVQSVERVIDYEYCHFASIFAAASLSKLPISYEEFIVHLSFMEEMKCYCIISNNIYIYIIYIYKYTG